MHIKRPRVLLSAAADLTVLRTTGQGPSRILHLWWEREGTSGHISVGTCLKDRAENAHDN
jgi:hypothetical protein